MAATKEKSTSTEILSEANDEELASLVKLINTVYDVAEKGMWKVTGFRTKMEELQTLVEAKQLIVARNGGGSMIVGCIKVQKIQDDMGGFGMLVVDPTCREQGIGGQLVRAAEKWAFDRRYSKMQLELLTPRTWKQPSKEFNKAWYARLGYVPQTTAPFVQDYPQLTPLIATECDYTVWMKPLILVR